MADNGRSLKYDERPETCGNRQDDLNGKQVTKKKITEVVASCGERNEGRGRRWNACVYIKTPHHALSVITGNADPSLDTQGWFGDKLCLVTVDTGANVTVAKPDISAGWPERHTNQPIQTANGNWGSAPHHKISLSNSDSDGVNLGFRHQYHQ
jgi:hypothetical protein